VIAVKGLIAGVFVIVILALLLPGSRSDDSSDSRPKASAKAATVRVGGSFERSTRGDGMPVFSAVDVKRGDTLQGSVEIANRGRGNGYFILSQADLTDLPGPAGGALSKRLGLTVRDVTSKRKPVTIYRGALNAMGARSVGFIEPGDSRRYRFTARVDRPGDARRIPGVDDPYENSAATVRYVWSAVDAAPPQPGRPPRKLGDRRPPVLKVEFPRVQRLLERDHLLASVACNERCIVRTRGSVRAGTARTTPTPPLITALRRGQRLTLRTSIPRGALAAMRRSLRAGRPATIRLTIQARDRAGNRAAVKRRVRLNPTVR
jgi:hypothetical protein